MFFGKAYPTPIVKPLWPFMVGGVVVTYLFSLGANAAMSAPDYVDPKTRALKKHAGHGEH